MRELTLAAWHKAFQGITANGMTSCGVGLEMMRRRKQRAEQIILVTDEEEYDPPYFVDALLRYQRELGPVEIAETLDMPLNTVKSHLKRSLAVLRARCARVRQG